MEKHFFFLSGLPRSGSTLLSSILNQNPELYASANSPVSDMMFGLEVNLLDSEQYLAYPKPHVVSETVLGIMRGYYSDQPNKKYIIDKSRVWATEDRFHLLLRNLPYSPKIIVLVRDITDILASMIRLLEKTGNNNNFIDFPILNNQSYQKYRPLNDLRCDHMMGPRGLIDNSLSGVAFASQPNYSKYFHFIEYEDLLADPQKIIENLYNFLELEKYEHDFSNIKNSAQEDDAFYGIPGMHEVRPTISKRSYNKEEILSEYVLNKYSGLEFWRDKNEQ